MSSHCRRVVRPAPCVARRDSERAQGVRDTREDRPRTRLRRRRQSFSTGRIRSWMDGWMEAAAATGGHPVQYSTEMARVSEK